MITKAFKIVNTPLKYVFIRKFNHDIDWNYYGFSVSTLSRLGFQYEDYSGNYMQILPISNNERAESLLPELKDIIANNDFDNDSIDIISWEDAQKIIDELTEKRSIDQQNGI